MLKNQIKELNLKYKINLTFIYIFIYFILFLIIKFFN